MKKRFVALLLLLLLPVRAALCETYAGKTVAIRMETLWAECSGILQELSLTVGQTIKAGETVGSIKPTAVFAKQDGTVARITAKAGDAIDGTVLELSPESKFTVSCTSEGAYERVDNQLMHCGETVYIRCINDGSHRGVGVISQIEGTTYQVIATGGEFYNGETVRLYRKPGYPYLSLIGEGTVIASKTEAYAASGALIDLHVQEGEQVERGQLLFTYGETADLKLCSPCDGTLSEIHVSTGERLEKGQAVATIIPKDALRVEIQVSEEELALLSIGQNLSFIRADDPEETPIPGTIEDIRWIAEDETYTVTILPSTFDLPFGLSVEVDTE